MDLFFATVCSQPEGSAAAGDGGLRCSAAKVRPSEAPPATEQAFAESLSGCCREPDAGTTEASSRSENPPVLVRTSGVSTLAHAFAVQLDGQGSEEFTEEAPSEQGLPALLGSEGAAPLAEAPPAKEQALGQGPSPTGQDAAGIRPGAPTQNGLQPPTGQDGAHKEAHWLLGSAEHDLEVTVPRCGADTLLSNLAAKKEQSLTGAENLLFSGAKGQKPEGSVPSATEGIASKGDTQESPARVAVPLMNVGKGTGEPFDPHLGASPAGAHEGPGETVPPWTGREGPPVRQEIPIEVSARPPTPAAASQSPSMPLPPQHGVANGGLHILENTVHMRIHDDELGSMRWHVRLDGEKITAEAVVETTRVQELLRSHQDVLQAKLNAIGVEVEDFDVFVDQGSQRFSSFSERRVARPSLRTPEEALPLTGFKRPGRIADTTLERRLDLYV